MDKTVRVIFIVPESFKNKTECSAIMHRAYEACKTNSMAVDWLESTDDFDDLSVEKMDFLVFETFDGDRYNRFKDSRIVGPSCLLTCLVEGRPIPNLPWPISNVAMSDCFVTVSRLSRQVKEQIQDKVKMMAGYYTDNVYDTTTHLITDSVKSEKYLRASEAGAKVMLPGWVDDVWKASQSGNIHCNDASFDKHLCPPFYNLTIAITGFATLEVRQKIAKLVKENGGNFTSQLHVSTTDVLICEESTNTEKYKVARKSRSVKCVTYNWLLDSIKKGYALPDVDYSLKKPTSTPTKLDHLEEPNFSMMSAISSVCSTTQRSIFQETILQTSDTTLSSVTPRKRKSSSLDDITDLIDAIDLKGVKRAGSFLDGCCVYIAGFTLDQREKLSRILSLGDATRYDQISERITHIIVGDPTSSDVKVMQCRGYAAPLVSLEWVNECIRQRRVVGEERFLVNLHRNDSSGSTSSPLSQKGLKLLRREISVIEPASRTITADDNDETLAHENEAHDIDAEILQQYKKAPTSTEEDTLANLLNLDDNFESKRVEKNDETEISRRAVVNANANDTSSQAVSITMTETEDETTDGVFQHLKFQIVGFAPEDAEELKQSIENNSGQVVPKTFRGKPDFVVLPIFYTEELSVPRECLVTHYFLTSCINANSMVELEYYHQPLDTSDSNPLDGCVITVSAYTGMERAYLNDVVVKLGGKAQEQLCRVPKPDIFACTHLLSPEAKGRKYEAAVKWGLPVISKEWLMECARTGRYANEVPHLIGNAKASERSKAAKLETPKEPDFPSTESIMNAFDDDMKEKASHADENTLLPNSSKENISVNCGSFRVPTVNEKSSVSTPKDQGLPGREENDDEVFHLKTQAFSANTSKTGNNTPKTPKNYFPGTNKPGYTPLRLSDDSFSQVSSQVTPVNKIMQRFRMNDMLGSPTASPPLPRRYNEVDTPETPYGAFITPNPSPHLRKEMLKWLNRIPEHKPRRDSTPFSEIKRQLWNKICPPPSNDNNGFPQPNFEASEDTPETIETAVKTTAGSTISSLDSPDPKTPQRSKIDSNLQQLQEMIASSSGNSRRSLKKRESILHAHEAPQLLSQVHSVVWDYSEAERAVERVEPVKENTKRTFMVTSLNKTERDNIIRQIQELGGIVSDQQQYDPEGTHLITPKPQRTEKILSSMAAGKWILHPSYVEKSSQAGRFLQEETFEYGNPKASKDISVQFERDLKLGPEALHYWRVEVGKRGYGAFHDMRAIVVGTRRESIVRVIEAGGGMVINESPPFEDSVYATHCLIEEKTTQDLSPYIPLAKHGVYCVGIVYISDFLYRNARDVRDSVLPYFAQYYKE